MFILLVVPISQLHHYSQHSTVHSSLMACQIVHLKSHSLLLFFFRTHFISLRCDVANNIYHSNKHIICNIEIQSESRTHFGSAQVIIHLVNFMAFALVVFGVYGSSMQKKETATANKHKECREKFVHVNLTLLTACVALVSFRCDRCSTAQREDVWGELLMSHWALGDCHVALRWLTAACAFMPNVQRSPTSYGHQHEIKKKSIDDAHINCSQADSRCFNWLCAPTRPHWARGKSAFRKRNMKK